MHFRFVFRQLGYLLLLLVAAMVLAAGWSVYDLVGSTRTYFGHKSALLAFVITIGTGILTGLLLIFVGRGAKQDQLGRREALLLVALSWFVGAALAALPFRLWAFFHQLEPGQDHAFGSFVNCYFESMSGLTTTGATVLTNIPTLPESLLLWRAFTHWLGGLGIVVLFVAVLPMLGVGGKRLFRIESPGPTSDGVTPRIQETARRLWFIYLGLTVAQIIALLIADRQMSLLDAITHTFATLATGGFSTHNASVGAFGPAVQWTVTFFMVLAGVNFAIYHQLLNGQFRQVFKSTELRAYLGILIVTAFVIYLNTNATRYQLTDGTFVQPVGTEYMRQAIFQTVSIQTTTGFCTANFDQWPLLSRFLLVTLMFVGASGGSTGGGIKVIRIVVMIRVMWAEVERVFRPHVVRTVRVAGGPVDGQQQTGILAYVLGVLLIAGAGTLLLTVTERANDIDGVTALTAVAATLNNIGPGLAHVGAVENYAWFSVPGKLIMSVLMAVGRLEIFAVIVIFMPRFWRSE